jgi:hypothetical protein
VTKINKCPPSAEDRHEREWGAKVPDPFAPETAKHFVIKIMVKTKFLKVHVRFLRMCVFGVKRESNQKNIIII